MIFPLASIPLGCCGSSARISPRSFPAPRPPDPRSGESRSSVLFYFLFPLFPHPRSPGSVILDRYFYSPLPCYHRRLSTGFRSLPSSSAPPPSGSPAPSTALWYSLALGKTTSATCQLNARANNGNFAQSRTILLTLSPIPTQSAVVQSARARQRV